MAKKESFCPVAAAMALISGKWKLVIIHFLLEGPKRFNQLQRDLGNVTHRALTKQLREMEQDKLVIRKDYGEVPPRVDYRLAPLGRSLYPVLMAMEEWAVKQRLSTKRK